MLLQVAEFVAGVFQEPTQLGEVQRAVVVLVELVKQLCSILACFGLVHCGRITHGKYAAARALDVQALICD